VKRLFALMSFRAPFLFTHLLTALLLAGYGLLGSSLPLWVLLGALPRRIGFVAMSDYA
jgi:carbon starvation protein CstA